MRPGGSELRDRESAGSMVIAGDPGLTAQLRRSVRGEPWLERLGIVAALLAVLAATNRWMSWSAGFRLLRALDESNYRTIALAAPHLPRAAMPEQHAQRFVPHYLIGLIAHGLDAPVESVYRVAAVVLALGICLALHVLLTRIGLSTRAYAVCMALFVLNAYSLRLYILVPGYLADLVFVLGLVVVLIGLLDRRLATVLIGLVVATAARQTMVPAALVVAYWVGFAAHWRDAPARLRVTRVASVLLASPGVYLAISAVARSFSAHSTPGLTHWTVLGDLEQLPASVGTVGNHVLRSVNPLLGVAALLAVSVGVGVRAKLGDRLTFAFWGSLCIGALIIAQPLIFSPEYAGKNETRLATLSLVAFVLALALLLRRLERHRVFFSREAAAIVVALLAAGSLHHIYTVVGLASAFQTVLLQLLAALAAIVVVWRSTKAAEPVALPAAARP